ncbi:MAG: hypothetical protein M0Q92_12225 [Methanoregula sp.]|nr:hypothetical protein [Methanoregula sp.]
MLHHDVQHMFAEINSNTFETRLCQQDRLEITPGSDVYGNPAPSRSYCVCRKELAVSLAITIPLPCHPGIISGKYSLVMLLYVPGILHLSSKTL